MNAVTADSWGRPRAVLTVVLLACVMLAPLVLEVVTKEREESTFHIWLGRTLIVFYIGLIAWQWGGRRLVNKLDLPAPSLAWLRPSPAFKTWFMFAAGLAALATYTYCHHVCEKKLFNLDENITFSHRIFSFSLSIGALFICACILSAYVGRLLPSMSRKLPTGMLSSGLFAALIPTCACGSIPVAKGMLDSDRIPLRSIITFLMVAPVLNPYLIVFSFQLGTAYALLRIGGIFAIAMLTGIVIEWRLSQHVPDPGDDPYALPCRGCRKPPAPAAKGNVFEMSWDLMVQLMPYFAVGIFAGALISEYLPHLQVLELLRSNVLGLFLIIGLSLPLFLCAGQEIILLMPFISGLYTQNPMPLGHALAFTIAGTGICISSVPLLYKVVGRKVTAGVVAGFFIGSIVLGLIVNWTQALLQG